MPKPYQRVRVTSATMRRAENFAKLIAAFNERKELQFDEICDVLEMSPSGGRKYIRELEDAGAAQVVGRFKQHPNHEGQAVYWLTDAEKLTEFVALLQQPGSCRPAPLPRRKHDPLPAGHRIHILEDDVRQAIPRASTAVRPDPFALPREFFGPAGQVSA